LIRNCSFSADVPLSSSSNPRSSWSITKKQIDTACQPSLWLSSRSSSASFVLCAAQVLHRHAKPFQSFPAKIPYGMSSSKAPIKASQVIPSKIITNALEDSVFSASNVYTWKNRLSMMIRAGKLVTRQWCHIGFSMKSWNNLPGNKSKSENTYENP
jgi:hypothetical protein